MHNAAESQTAYCSAVPVGAIRRLLQWSILSKDDSLVPIASWAEYGLPFQTWLSIVEVAFTREPFWIHNVS
jgi:hypothetical protein